MACAQIPWDVPSGRHLKWLFKVAYKKYMLTAKHMSHKSLFMFCFTTSGTRARDHILRLRHIFLHPLRLNIKRKLGNINVCLTDELRWYGCELEWHSCKICCRINAIFHLACSAVLKMSCPKDILRSCVIIDRNISAVVMAKYFSSSPCARNSAVWRDKHKNCGLDDAV